MKELTKTLGQSKWRSYSRGFSISSSMKSIDLIQKDELEVLSNQIAFIFLGLLATMEHHSHEERDRRVSFRSVSVSGCTDMATKI